MFSRFFKNRNSVTLGTFLQKVFHDHKDPYDTLNLNRGKLEMATLDQILDNPGDVADGVNAVEMDFSTTYFSYFRTLVIKHQADGIIRWMFYDTIDNATTIINIFTELKSTLGEGFIEDQKFATFYQVDKVNALSCGRWHNANDEILHLWQNKKVTVLLNYQLQPLQRLLLSFTIHPEKKINTMIRNKGTLVELMQHDLHLLLIGTELKAVTTEERGTTKFIDYTYELIPEELNYFNMVDIRLFSLTKFIAEETHTNVTYWSTHALEVKEVILLVDKLCRLYGPDNHGDEEMKPYEIELVENKEFWTGRSWDFNESHALINYDDKDHKYLYNFRLNYDPDDLGLTISIIGYNKMLEYHLQHFN